MTMSMTKAICLSHLINVLLSEHRGCPTEVSFCCSVGFFVDFEKDPVSVHVGPMQCR